MKKLILAAGMMLAAVHATPDVAAIRPLAPTRHCGQLFTVRMGERAARAIYARPRAPRLRQLRVMGYIERCQRNPAAQRYVRWFDHRQAALRAHRIYMTRIMLPYGEWAIPASIVRCESGFRNLAPNGADASGYYQILGSTWRDNGGSAPYEAYEHSKAEQDAVAARIWHGGQGAGQWVCKA